jgi:hypothetical protein
MQQFYLTRGYRSSVDPILLFGCGTDTLVNEVQVIWPDNTLTTLQKLETNQSLLIDFNVVARVPEPVSDHQEKGILLNQIKKLVSNICMRKTILIHTNINRFYLIGYPSWGHFWMLPM